MLTKTVEPNGIYNMGTKSGSLTHSITLKLPFSLQPNKSCQPALAATVVTYRKDQKFVEMLIWFSAVVN